MKTYKVGFWYTLYGTTTVKATGEKQARNKAQKHLSEYGLDELEYKCNDREYGAEDVEEIINY